MQQYSEFGAEARKRMLQKGITMTEIANELGITKSYLSEILKGTRRGKKQKPVIAKMLGMESEVKK